MVICKSNNSHFFKVSFWGFDFCNELWYDLSNRSLILNDWCSISNNDYITEFDMSAMDIYVWIFSENFIQIVEHR